MRNSRKRKRSKKKEKKKREKSGKGVRWSAVPDAPDVNVCKDKMI